MAALRSSPSYLAVLTDPELAERAHYYPSVELCDELLHRWEEAEEKARELEAQLANTVSNQKEHH